MKKRAKEFENLIAELTDLQVWEFKEVIAIAKQFRKAQQRLGKAMDRQEREIMLPQKTAKAMPATGGVNYELQ